MGSEMREALFEKTQNEQYPSVQAEGLWRRAREAWASLRRQPPHLLIGCGLMALGGLLLVLTKPRGSFVSAPSSWSADVTTVAEASVALDGTYETIEGREAVWQIPVTPPGSPPQGVAFFAHGCGHKATHWWPQSPACPACIGLPEDVALVRQALGRGYAVIAVSSLGKCWDAAIPASDSLEISGVGAAIDRWREHHKLGEPLPLVALGASSGGYFISCLAHRLKVEAQVIMISSGVSRAFEKETELGAPYPATLFVHMPKDDTTAVRVADSMRLLREDGVQTAEIRCYEMKLSEDFFSKRIDEMDEETSKNIFLWLSRAGLVNEEGYLVPAFRDTWQDLLKDKGVLRDRSMVPRVNEELHLAFGWHEMTSEHATEIVDWFQGVCSSDQGAGGGGNGPVLGAIHEGRCKSYS